MKSARLPPRARTSELEMATNVNLSYVIRWYVLYNIGMYVCGVCVCVCVWGGGGGGDVLLLESDSWVEIYMIL